MENWEGIGGSFEPVLIDFNTTVNQSFYMFGGLVLTYGLEFRYNSNCTRKSLKSSTNNCITALSPEDVLMEKTASAMKISIF